MSHWKMKKTRTAHFSVDDTIWILENLGHYNYKSIFEQPVLAFFQRLHEQYGVTVSFYCFGEYQGLSLDQMTTKYQEEFSDNSSWMRFGFHAAADTDRYDQVSSQKAASDYAGVVQSLSRIVGEEAIDHFVRIHYYAASKDALRAMRKKGMEGCLGSGYVMRNYYLHGLPDIILNKTGSYYDKKIDIAFLRTDLQMEKVCSIEKAVKKLRNRKHAEIFTHEWALDEICKRKISDLCARIALYEDRKWIFSLERKRGNETNC